MCFNPAIEPAVAQGRFAEAMRTKSVFDVFIPAALDDAGLTAPQVRVFIHVARRAGRNGVAYGRVPMMAKVCKLNPKTVYACLKYLVQIGWLQKEARPGKTSVYRLMPETGGRHPTQTDTHLSKLPTRLPNSMPKHPTQTDTHKGPPPEGPPNKGTAPQVPARISSNETHQKLYPRELDKLISDANAKIPKLKETPGEAAAAAIVQLRENIHDWECQKLGVRLPAPRSTQRPAVQPKATQPQGRAIKDIPRSEWLEKTNAIRERIKNPAASAASPSAATSPATMSHTTRVTTATKDNQTTEPTHPDNDGG